MKNKTKIIAVCAASSMMLLGASMTSFAAGWEQQGDTWVYLDSSNNRVTDSWRRSGDFNFYLDSNGEMAVDAWVEDTYYVDQNGVMVTNRWVYAEEGTEGAPNSEGGWFYLDAAGRAVTDQWRTIGNNRYHFDSDGSMNYGWFTDDDNLYYLGDENDGAAKTGWICLEYDEDEQPDDGDVSEIVTSGGKWFYFQSNGRAVRASENTYVNRTINGYRYYFDENGVMATGWVSMGEQEEGDVTGISTLKYFGDADSGQMARGWRYLIDDPEDSEDDDEDFSFATATSSNAESLSGDGNWYYFDNDGVPKYLNQTADSVSDATARISGQNYFFDEYGRMQSGLIGIHLADGSLFSAYFGADDSDGRMKTDRQTSVYEDNGDRSTFFFTASGGNKGGGYTGVRSNYLYYNGKQVTAEDGEDFEVFEVGDERYLVNEAGRVQTSSRFYRVDGEYRYEIAGGVIYEVNDERERIGEASANGRLPEIDYKTVYSLSE